MRQALMTVGAAVLSFFVVVIEARAFDCTGTDPSPGTEIHGKLVTGGLTRPVDVTGPPGDTSRVFVVDQTGRLRIVDIITDTLVATPFLDIGTKVDYGGEKGLLGLAFHPNYAQNGFFFVNYTRPGGPTGLETVIARYQVSASDPNLADPASEKILLHFAQPFANHNGGQLQFGPNDGFLYISTGDGGSGGDPNNNSQNPQSFLGKILRIDVDSGDPYGIPPSNPFAGDPKVLGEIWALGLRNPWRFSFDQETGDMYIGDVGQNLYEEIDFEPGTSPGGMNYQWRVMEGKHSYSPSTSYTVGTKVAPILEYPHAQATLSGCSVTGGVVYRGCSMPDLQGAYFFAEYCNDWIRTLRVENGKAVNIQDRSAEIRSSLTDPSPLSEIVAFGVDGRGEVYICDLPGKLYRVISANPPSSARLFQRGNANGDDSFDISDPVATLLHLFGGSSQSIPCSDAYDSNDDGKIDLSDAVYSLSALFTGGPVPPPPGFGCGSDPTEDALACDASTCR